LEEESLDRFGEAWCDFFLSHHVPLALALVVVVVAGRPLSVALLDNSNFFVLVVGNPFRPSVSERSSIDRNIFHFVLGGPAVSNARGHEESILRRQSLDGSLGFVFVVFSVVKSDKLFI